MKTSCLVLFALEVVITSGQFFTGPPHMPTMPMMDPTTTIHPQASGQPCLDGVIWRQDGEVFMDACNQCECFNGGISCTQFVCPDCTAMNCPTLTCANQYTPPGSCCAECVIKK